MANAIPEGYEGAVPYLGCQGAAAAIEFYKQAFGATELFRFDGPNGTIGHAEIKIGQALVMLADEWPEGDFRSPLALGGTPVGIMVYVEDVDALVEQAAAAGARVIRPPADQFYGDRTTTLLDPYGHRWFFSTHVEDVPMEELERRSAALSQGGG